MKPAQVAFEQVIIATGHLKLKPGLQAILRSEGYGQIVAGDSNVLLGSAAIDEDCKSVNEAFFSQGARWDYIVGAQKGNGCVAFFVEVHSADTSGVSEVEKKLRWLLDFLKRSPQTKLSKLPREIHWVASGRINIPKHLPQYKKLSTTLRKLGLQGPVKRLGLNAHP